MGHHSKIIYEVNTRIWLNELSREHGHSVSLSEIPDSAVDRLAEMGVGWLWLMGVWQTGPAGRRVSQQHGGLRQAYAESLQQDLRESDIQGSPYAIQDYSVHADFGGNGSLHGLRNRLRERGIRLLLDFVPNNTALDHLWVAEQPDYYVHGSQDDLHREPWNYCVVHTNRGDEILAHGRDPYFPAWPDTLQLNYASPLMREAMKQELLRVADLCDGVRCDMAMLLLPDVFWRVWPHLYVGFQSPSLRDMAFWPCAIAAVRAQNPGFVFMAEVYWDMEGELLQQGFDYVYDKRLCDRLRDRDAPGLRIHLAHTDYQFQRRCVRYIENHDEPRAAAVLPQQVHFAAAVICLLSPGLSLLHDGQLEGFRMKLSVHLNRREHEHPVEGIRSFYGRLLACVMRPEVGSGTWYLLDCYEAWPGNPTFTQFIAFMWVGKDDSRMLVVVNYGPTRGQCYVRFPADQIPASRVRLSDLMSSAWYERSAADLNFRGLYLDLQEWGYHVFVVSTTSLPRPPRLNRQSASQSSTRQGI